MRNNEIKNNSFAQNEKKRKLDLGTIAEIMATETNGFISKDLYDALILANEAGLNAEDKPFNPEWILWEDRKLNYDAEKLSKEADLVLMLRAKAGDKAAMTKLFNNKKNILMKMANDTAQYYVNSNAALERDVEYYMQETYLAFLYHVIQHPVCSKGKILFSHTNLNFSINDNIHKKHQMSSDYINFGSVYHKASQIKKQLVANGTDINDITREQFEEFSRLNVVKETTINKLYEVFKYSNSIINRYEEKKMNSVCDTDDFDDICDEYFSGNKTMTLVRNYQNTKTSQEELVVLNESDCFALDPYNTLDPINTIEGETEIIQLINKLRQDKKHGRDVETLLTHIMGEKDFSFKKLFADKAVDHANLQVTADIMGYENAYEVKKAMKRAKDFIIFNIKKDPEMFSSLTRDRKRYMAS